MRLCHWHEVCRLGVVRHACMRIALLIAVIFSMGLSALGCKKSERTGRAVKEPVQSNMAFNYTFDKREVFIADAIADLTEVDQRINELADDATTAGAVIKAAAEPKIEDLRKQRFALENKLNALRSANAANWNELTADYQNAELQMKVSLQKSWQWFKDNTHS